MLKPHRYLDYNNSILVVGAKILSILQNDNVLKYDLLLVKLLEHNDNNIRYVFAQSLSFLFLLGKIDYDSATDEVGLTS